MLPVYYMLINYLKSLLLNSRKQTWPSTKSWWKETFPVDRSRCLYIYHNKINNFIVLFNIILILDHAYTYIRIRKCTQHETAWSWSDRAETRQQIPFGQYFIEKFLKTLCRCWTVTVHSLDLVWGDNWVSWHVWPALNELRRSLVAPSDLKPHSGKCAKRKLRQWTPRRPALTHVHVFFGG